MTHQFNEDYYENGVKKRVSGYANYRWMPTRSIPEAIDIKKKFNPKTCVDIGCAKGFLVHALRLLGCETWGEDISEYALENCYPKVRDYLSLPNDKKYELLICKDVLEHIDEKSLPEFLTRLLLKGEKFFFVIPLGDNDSFRIREYEVDVTHVTKKNEEWWLELLEKMGYRLLEFSYSLGTVKEKWTKPFPYGNGFFVLEKK
tara:strand:- start:673 stop:1278 length:606 start_codon:yes stop_codon:yes gene_type:complete